MKKIKLSKGFTLIELLVVIAIVGVLAGAVWVAINPLDKINAANDSRRQSDVGALATAQEAYAAAHNGYYAVDQDALVASGDLKSPLVGPGAVAYGMVVTGDTSPCSSGVDCNDVRICATMASNKYTIPETPGWVYSSSNGKTCQLDVDDCTADCP